MSVYCKFYDNKQTFISRELVDNGVSIPSNAVSGLFYDNTYKMSGLDILNNVATELLVFTADREYLLYIFPIGVTSFRATSTRSNVYMSGVPELSQNDIDYLKNLSSDSTVDFSTIVTALNSITSALSALTNLTNLSNLSNLTDLANIITAITNKDNQSNITAELDKIFISKFDNVDYSLMKPDTNILSSISSSYRTRYTLSGILTRLMSLLTSNKRNLDIYFSDFSSNTFRQNNQSLFESSAKTSFQNLQDISTKLENIETKLEQNLPFTTLAQVDVVTDYTQVVKGVGKNE